MMKFQLKALVVALSLAAVSVSAQAATDRADSGNGSFILTLIDRAANVSAAFDLGINYADFNQVALAGAVTNVTDLGTVRTWNLAQGDYALGWNAFTAAANINSSIFGVFAGDRQGTGNGSQGYITTFVAAGGLSTGQMQSALSFHDSYVQDTAFGANGVSNMNTVANGSSFRNPATTYFNSNKNNNTGPVALGLVGNSLIVNQYTANGASLTQASFITFANDATFTLNANGTLTYMTAPVPEADTWAMMVAGLGLMGFVARRRSRNQA